MTPGAEALLNHLAELGIGLEAAGTELILYPPAELEVTADLYAAVQAYKDEVLAALTVDVKPLDLVELGDVPLPEKRPTTPEATASICGRSQERITPLGLTPADETVWEGEVRWR